MTLKCVNIGTGKPSGGRPKNIFGHVADKHSHFLQFINLIIFHTFPVFKSKIPTFPV